MSTVVVDVSVSVDGFLAGPDATLEEPLGAGGELLHEWLTATRQFRERHGLEGGDEGADSDLVGEHVAAIGATVMGRRMFSGGAGPWSDDPNANGWWGDEPPFRHPVFVLTHHAREPLDLEGTTFTFVTGGAEEALALASESADGRAVAVAGGANVIQQFLRAGLVDELQLHVSPVLLGGGVPLFDHAVPGPRRLVRSRVVDSPGAAHLRYTVRAG